MTDQYKTGNNATRLKQNYSDADRFIEYIFKSGRPDVIERVIELARQKGENK